jgi:hypothetical protein
VTYFADLSPYAYTSGPDVISLDTPPYSRQVDATRPRANVGWLDHTHRFTAGTVTAEVANALLDVISHQRVSVMRGFHTCPFCPRDPDPGPLPLDHQGRTAWMGNGEIRIPAADGALFAAPTLIGHYVIAHRYRPPAAFTDALTAYRHATDDLALGWIPNATTDQDSNT